VNRESRFTTSCLFAPDLSPKAETDRSASVTAAGDDPFILILDVSTGKAVRQFEAQGHEVSALACSPDGKLVAAGTTRGTVLLWDSAAGVQVARRSGHPSAIQQITFTADGKRLASVGGTDTTH
jgi:WD40 repeat protein